MSDIICFKKAHALCLLIFEYFDFFLATKNLLPAVVLGIWPRTTERLYVETMQSRKQLTPPVRNTVWLLLEAIAKGLSQT